jgi:hypothetical protein
LIETVADNVFENAMPGRANGGRAAAAAKAVNNKRKRALDVTCGAAYSISLGGHACLIDDGSKTTRPLFPFERYVSEGEDMPARDHKSFVGSQILFVDNGKWRVFVVKKFRSNKKQKAEGGAVKKKRFTLVRRPKKDRPETFSFQGESGEKLSSREFGTGPDHTWYVAKKLPS